MISKALTLLDEFMEKRQEELRVSRRRRNKNKKPQDMGDCIREANEATRKIIKTAVSASLGNKAKAQDTRCQLTEEEKSLYLDYMIVNTKILPYDNMRLFKP